MINPILLENVLVLNILVADAETSEDPLKKMIENCGFRVRMARSGKEALSFFRETNFDLILLDMFLPDCLGYELIPEFRMINPDIRIVGTTTHNTREIERNNRVLGVTYYMSKPLIPEELQSLLRHMARQINSEVGVNDRNLYDENTIHSIGRVR